MQTGFATDISRLDDLGKSKWDMHLNWRASLGGTLAKTIKSYVNSQGQLQE